LDVTRSMAETLRTASVPSAAMSFTSTTGLRRRDPTSLRRATASGAVNR
jgi:hypothetical protein